MPACSTQFAQWTVALVALLACAGARAEALTLPVRIPGGTLTLELEPRDDLLADPARDAPAIARGADVLYTGTVRGHPGSWVRAARIEGRWSGLASDGAAWWAIEDEGAAGASARAVALAERASVPTVTTRFLRMRLVLDTQFQALYGSGANSRAGAMVNVVDGIYRAQTSVGIAGVTIVALASNGTLTATDATTLLTQFQAFIAGAGGPNPGSAHLLTGRDLDSTSVGLGFQNQVCTASSVAIEQSTSTLAFDGSNLAHELGHGFGAVHDSSGGGNLCTANTFVMGAVRSMATPPTAFSTCSVAEIAAFLQANPTTCLLTPPPDAMLLDGFE